MSSNFDELPSGKKKKDFVEDAEDGDDDDDVPRAEDIAAERIVSADVAEDSMVRVSLDELEDKVGPEEELKRPITTYRMRPALGELFQASRIKSLIRAVLIEKLQGKVYNPDDAGKWTREISDQVSTAVKEQLDMPRFKHVVQVTLGQQLGAGCRYIAKCCWDAEADSQTSDVYTNPTLFCVCTVFGVYLY